MLETHDTVATVAVRDINAARTFYGETLGLKQVHDEGGEAITYRTGNSTLLVYRSQFAGTNQATACTWNAMKDVPALVAALEAKGVKFERYDMPNVKHEGSVHVYDESHRMAWFKDPDGNIHALISG